MTTARLNVWSQMQDLTTREHSHRNMRVPCLARSQAALNLDRSDDTQLSAFLTPKGCRADGEIVIVQYVVERWTVLYPGDLVLAVLSNHPIAHT